MLYDVEIIEKAGKKEITTRYENVKMIGGCLIRNRDNKPFIFCNSFTFEDSKHIPLDVEETLKKMGFIRLTPVTQGINKNDSKDKKEDKHSGDTESRSPFHKTVEGMLSEDYKERFKAEYQQTKIRWERLKAFNTKILASKINVGTDEPKHDCPDGLLLDQEKTMRKYLDILELRAAIEGVDLTK